MSPYTLQYVYMTKALNAAKTEVRHGAASVAKWLDTLTKGRITPDMVTYVGFAMHVPIAVMIAFGYDLWAAGFLIVFGLFDTLDGELARLQKRAGPRGMLLDASTDRMKEVLLYCGVAFALALTERPETAVWAVAACGASLCVSYVKAKGEAAIASEVSGKRHIPHVTLNRMFSDGLLSFEMRMAVLVFGLIFNVVLWAVAVIAILAAFTAVQRLVRISKEL